ncbi:MAG: YidC/Oxa1 family membrane protein insertase [Peptococcaceae bacterium]|nr:YidC/Oxa1 family membrane protein insertase [Peptococcaceae bacterium]MDH7523822.1 YidC/Oxa1 family membrane protein insertase [Peptococcaceae bacterium]
MWQALVDFVASILRYLYDFTVSIGIPSYGLAIILLTLIIKVVLYPLTQKQMYSMKKMQELQPKVNEIQKKYKKNPEKANQAIMELYKEHKANPMSGCFPLLLQMPILIALFQALQKFQYKDLGASFLWIPHLKNPDPYYIIPVLVAVTTYMQSKLTTPATNTNTGPAANTQKMMLYFMPIFIGYISINFPSGLGLYWIFFSIFGTIQQMYINRQPDLQKGEAGGK